MRRRRRVLFTVAGLVLLALLAALLWGLWFWREDIRRTLLDPREPFQTYQPPPAPDYAGAEAWALRPDEPARWGPNDPPADVFFIHPTTYDGGGEWNAPVDHRRASAALERTMLPNYAAPFARAGRLFAPRYRQASLYSFLTLREDAREARAFAYNDIRDAFRRYVAEYAHGRPLIVVGVEQGGALADRLIREEIAPNPALREQLAGVYLIETVVPLAEYANGPIQPCTARAEAGCVVAWRSVGETENRAAQQILARALVWGDDGQLQNLSGPAMCVNPLLGRRTTEPAPARANLGAANATGLEWGVRPALLQHQVAARCVDGLLRVSRPESPSLRPRGGWADRRKAPPYNLFYADLQADAQARVAALRARPGWRNPVAPIGGVIHIPDAPIHRID